MRRVAAGCAGFLFLTMACGVFAQEPVSGSTEGADASMGQGEKPAMMMEKDKRTPQGAWQRMKGKFMEMPMMMPREMVATSDGGVVVLIGEKLLKYDKNLDLKAEAQLKIEKPQGREGMPGCPLGAKKDAPAAQTQTEGEAS
ncbi:MAG: hypothetical protein ACM3L6_00665 [Deltaproteobacteria bacterium]